MLRCAVYHSITKGSQKHNNFTVRTFFNRCACFLSPSEELSVMDQSIMTIGLHMDYETMVMETVRRA